MHPRKQSPRRTLGPIATVALSLLVSTAALGQPAIEGTWTEPFPWPDNATHATVLPTGKVMTWNEYEPDEFHLWDPATGTVTDAPHPGYNIFCTGHALLSDGRLLVSGGSIEANRGLPHASIYDPASNSWKAWRLPGERPRTYAVYVDDKDKVWLSDFGANAIVRFDPTTEKFDVYPSERSGANVRQILGRPGEVWLPESGTDHVTVIKTR